MVNVKQTASKQLKSLAKLQREGNLQGALAQGLELLREYPSSPDVHYFLANVCYETGRDHEAMRHLQTAMRLPGAKVELAAYNQVMGRFLQKRCLDELEQGALWLIDLQAKNGIAWDYYGLALLEKERFKEAEQAFRKADSLMSGNPSILNNLACALNSQELGVEAEKVLKKVLQLAPKMAVAHNNLGNALRTQGRGKEAVVALLKSVELAPSQAFTYNNLGLAYRVNGQTQEAVDSYLKALELQPNLIQVYPNLIDALRQLGQLNNALAYAETALKIAPELPELWAAYADLLRDANHLDAAIEAYIRTLSFRPDSYVNFNLRVYTNLLFCLNYHPDLSAEVIYNAYKEFNQRFGLPHWVQRAYPNSKDPGRKLKIAYATQSFYNHVCKFFFIPLLEHQDREQFEIYAYSNVIKADETTEYYKKIVDHYVVTTDLTDEEFVARIQQDEIDILIDLSGHTNGNRLPVFARKPAPVSAHWLDYGYTTGLTAIDYYITDAPTVEGDAQRYFAEQIVALNGPAYVYRPDQRAFNPTPLPYERNGYITFGTLSRSVRLNHHVVKVWASILDAIPNSHLVINSGDFKDPAVQDEMASRFERYGIHRSRLEIGYSSPAAAALATIDIGLDCFPHNSGTTLIETLYMGIPYVTLAGRPSIGRIGSSILHAVGHPEWIAHSELEYAQKAIILAHDIDLLLHLRQHLRKEMEQSLLMDEPAFAKSFDQALRQMWQAYCARE